ncbi:MAG: methyltransferase domain-containing protein, partial [Pirellulales bacterium]
MAASPQDIRWLTGPSAEEPLRIAMAIGDSLAASRQLRRHLSADQTRLVVEQADLRRRAKAKFSRAAEMFFTRVGLEQATDETIAAYKAGRFARRGRVADLCCGIGGDLIALASRAETTGYDLDESLLRFASENALAYNTKAELRCEDVTSLDLSPFDAWHIDPDRRAAGRRSVQLEHHQPDLLALESMLRTNPNAAVKLSPATAPPPEWSRRFELEWISHARECKQLVAWHGQLTECVGARRATALDSHGEPSTFLAQPANPPAAANSIGSHLYEPDSAVIAANLTGALAQLHELRPLAPGAVYLTSDQRVMDRLLSAFEVLAVESWSEKKIGSLLAKFDIGALEVKKRGVP